MKMGSLLLILIFMVLGQGYSQVEVRDMETDRTDVKASNLSNTSPNWDFEKRVNLRPIEKSNNDVEIRFYQHAALTNTRDLKILALKKGIWRGTLYSESNYPIVRIRKFRLKARDRFDELYKLLIKNNLTTLPSQEELQPKMRKVTVRNGVEVEHKFLITDGDSYTVEFKTSQNARVYSFYNPEGYSSFYLDVQELKDFVTIKKLFDTELKKK